MSLGARECDIKLVTITIIVLNTLLVIAWYHLRKT